MAQLYPIGLQRLFYKVTTADTTLAAIENNTLIVTAKIFDPDLVLCDSILFDHLESKSLLYFTEFEFYKEGIWIATFYEDIGDGKGPIEKAFQAYNTKKILVEGEFKISGKYKGPNVINN